MLKDKINLKKDHFRGNPDSRIVIVEYGDYECPYCRKAHDSISQLLKSDDDLLYVFRNFPLTELHPHAELCAETAEFAADHEKYWEMHDLLFANQHSLGLELMFELVESLQLPKDAYQHALKNRTYFHQVKSDYLSGIRNEINSTPSFFINDQPYVGPYDAITFEAVLTELRAYKKAS